MLVDMHLHECTYSLDSKISLEEIVTTARGRGLDAVCITDHDSMGLREYAAEYSDRTGFPIFVGIEFFSLQGDITAWGIEDYPGCRVDACHPFRNNNRGLEENLRAVKGLHGVEVLNGSTALEANRRAFSYCRELGLKTIGASDAHTMGQIGKYATWLPEKVDCLKDFVEQLKTRQVRPAVWNGSSYDVVDML